MIGIAASPTGESAGDVAPVATVEIGLGFTNGRHGAVEAVLVTVKNFTPYDLYLSTVAASLSEGGSAFFTHDVFQRALHRQRVAGRDSHSYMLDPQFFWSLHNDHDVRAVLVRDALGFEYTAPADQVESVVRRLAAKYEPPE